MWPNPQETANLVTFTEEILNVKLHFYVLCLKKCHAHRDYLYNFISDDGANNIFMLPSALLSWYNAAKSFVH